MESNTMAEAKGNPIVTLKAQAEKFDFSKLRTCLKSWKCEVK
ncbi:hypothetical protein [Wolbachia endosymbiont of Cimex lectularius]|nr:hypothetical protein [Wolbachia endosymbiont of Cimex lectularius]BAO99720.1 putative uncharacterized protein [Wolbachia endosymbiont of Cimex lectularius]